MIKHFNFFYNIGAEALFKVDTERFTPEMAKATLEFFSWDYDKKADPVEEVMKKYAMKAIQIATFKNYGTYGVIQDFKYEEGFGLVDGSIGIELITVHGYRFDIDELTMEII